MSRQVGELTSHIFQAPLNEKIAEDLNHKVQYKEQETTSSTMDHYFRWSVGPASRLLSEYRREEVEAIANAPIPRDVDPSLFCYVHRKGEEEDIDMEKLLSEKIESVDATSIRETPAEQCLFEHLYQQHLDGKTNAQIIELVSRLWLVAFMPERKVVGSCKEPGKFYYILKTYPFNCLVWPMLFSSEFNTVTFDAEVKELTYLHVTCEDDFKVLHTEVQSPLHYIALGKHLTSIAFHVGRLVSLHDSAASEGYRYLSEGARAILHQGLPQYDADYSSTMSPEEVIVVVTQMASPPVHCLNRLVLWCLPSTTTVVLSVFACRTVVCLVAYPLITYCEFAFLPGT